MRERRPDQIDAAYRTKYRCYARQVLRATSLKTNLAMWPLVGRARFRIFDLRHLVFKLLQHGLFLSAQGRRGLHGHPGRYGVTRIALPLSADLSQHGLELGGESLDGGLDLAQLAQLVEDLLHLLGERLRAGVDTPSPARRPARGSGGALGGGPQRAFLSWRFHLPFGAGTRGLGLCG
jgi:hypothetical protein